MAPPCIVDGEAGELDGNEKEHLLTRSEDTGVGSDEQHDDERDELSRAGVLAFAVGAVGDSVFGGMFNGFITIYFNQVVGLSNSLIGMAIML